MYPEEKYAWLFDMIDVTPIVRELGKKTKLGAPERLNYRAMVYSLFIRLVERMPFIKDLVNRLQTSEEFRIHCRFTGSDIIPSEAAYSRLFAELKGLSVFQDLHDKLVAQAYDEGFIDGSKVAVDATHVEARDASSPARSRKHDITAPSHIQMEVTDESQGNATQPTEPEPVKPKKRGRKSKAEREQWLQEQVEIEAAKNAFEKDLSGMLNHSLEEIKAHTPQHPSWGTKKNTERRENVDSAA
jgi:transposase